MVDRPHPDDDTEFDAGKYVRMNEIDKLKLEKIQAVEEAKKEADKLMMNTIIKYEEKLKLYKDTIKKIKEIINDWKADD